MYGCAIPVLIYGWIENNSDMLLDPEWIETNYPFIDFYASETIRNHIYSGAYGIKCKLTENGEIQSDHELEEEVKKLYNLWCDYIKKQKKSKSKSKEELPTLGYHLVISGDYEWEHKCYIPDFD